MARTPSLAPEVASSFRVSLTRTGEGADAAWLADVSGQPGSSARAETPEEAVRLALARVDLAAAAARDARASEARATSETRHSGRLLVRMPATLHDELAQVAERERVSLNQLINGVLAAAVGWRSGDAGNTSRAGEAGAAGTAGSLARHVSSRRVGIALLVNFVVVAIAGALAIALLVAAWQQG